MNKSAARVAALGSAMLAVFYFVTNEIPLLRNLDSFPASAMIRPFVLLLLPPLVWTWFFMQLERSAAMVTLLAAVAPQALYSWITQWPSFSLLSIDSFFYLFSGVLLPLAYAWFLFAVFRNSTIRKAAYFLWVFTTFQAMAGGVNMALALWGTRGSLATFWNESPLSTLWSLFAGPAILILYWGTQSFFFGAIRKQRRQAA